jgi:hypothetical protein
MNCFVCRKTEVNKTVVAGHKPIGTKNCLLKEFKWIVLICKALLKDYL